MCKYSYIYHSTCQHGSLNRLSYCDKAKALGLLRINGHPPAGDSADSTSGNVPEAPSSQPAVFSASKRSSSRSHSQQQHSHAMSTLTPTEAGASFAHPIDSSQEERLITDAALIPRSVLQSEPSPGLAHIHHANPAPEQQSFRRVHIEVPVGVQSSISMEITNDGKVTELVARFESFTGSGRSDASQGSHDDSTRVTSMSTHCDTASDAGTVYGPPSPRKPIPTQWLSTNSGPKLATAQRARVRVHKQGSIGGSPGEAKSLRGTRSSIDFGRACEPDGVTFLTKDALSTVETDLTSTTAARSPTKHQRASSKPAWHSPGASPQYDSPRQQHTPTLKTSPSKNLLFSPSSVACRGPSSVATSTGESVFHSAEGSVFHSAEGSPVRSTANSEHSFQSPAEVLHHDDIHIPYLQLSTDREDEQTAQKPGNVQKHPKAATISRGSRPKLSVDTSTVGLRVATKDDSSATVTSATSSSAASNSPWSAASAPSNSRIPRVAAGSATSSARGPTRSSTLKRTQSVKTLTSPKAKVQHEEKRGPDNMLKSSTPTAASVRHVRTVNSSGRTPILTRWPTIECEPFFSTVSSDQPADKPVAKETEDTLAQVTSTLQKLNADLQQELMSQDTESVVEQSTRVSSMCTVKATPVVDDYVKVDSPMSCSNRSGASGTLRVPNSTPSAASIRTVTGAYGCSALQDGPEQVPSAVPRRTQSTYPLRSNGESDLRATAAEFVPYVAGKVTPESKEATPAPTSKPMTDLLGDQKFELDMYGIPWFYYMNQVQFAYQQGFYYGRSKSPKKAGNGRKKNRSIVSSPTNVTSSHNVNGQVTGFTPGLAPSFTPGPDHHRAPDIPPPPSNVPLAEQRAHQKLSKGQNNESPTINRNFSPFSAQTAVIAHQAAELQNTTNTPRGPKLDLTTIRNVPTFGQGPNNIAPPSYHNATPNRSHFHNRRNYGRSDNGLYSNSGGRGMAGVPIHDTMPFPSPIRPQGRPNGGINENSRGHATHVPDYRLVGMEACGSVDIVFAAERVGGEACNACEPDHPLE